MSVNVTVNYGTDERTITVEKNSSLGAAIIGTGLPLEQPCAGRGTCHKCKVIAEGELSPYDEKELEGLTQAERGANYRLACRTRVLGDVEVTLAPIVVYSN
ncbi:MAG: 2Fe-2S iron-sulfur cluster-binding protein, partial [Anaerolineae bacterium]